MGETVSAIAAVAPLVIALALILLAQINLRRVEKSGGYVEIDWKTVAFRIKCSFSPEGQREAVAPPEGAAPSEKPAVDKPPDAPGGAANPPSGGGSP